MNSTRRDQLATTRGTQSHCLAAVPWTAFCIQGQEIADRSQGDSADNLHEWLVNAA